MGDASVTVAILAGGQGRRLGGVDKGLHLLDGVPLIARVIAAIEAMQPPNYADRHLDVLIVANRNIEKYSSYARTLPDAVDCGEGPLAGIATALSAIGSTWLLTLPVDCPRPSVDLYRRLHAAIGDADCAVAHDGLRRQPLFALYRAGSAASAMEASNACTGPHAWQNQMDTVEVDLRDRREDFANLNTAAEFSAFGNVADE